jgi:hypothetical protein
MKTTIIKVNLFAAGLLLLCAVTAQADPRTNSWLTTYSGQYARIYTNNMMLTNGTKLTTWSNGSLTQSAPAYCGVQEVYSSSNSVYVRSSGLASYTMGPWQDGAFPNLPVNQKIFYRVPRTTNAPASKSITGGGSIGIFVDGVEMFNSWDAFSWNGSADVSAGNTTYYWNRDAYVNEGATFDPGYAHQQNTGTYHYHASPIALRYLLGDHVDFNTATQTYYEDTNAPTKHSPILGWVADGFPVYGPYGYSNPTNPAGGIRRMVSGYVPRNGLNGTDNLSTNGAARSSIPAWATNLFGVASAQSGPTVSTSYPFGRYMEDNAYLGDLTNSATGSNYQQGVDFDLDQYNGRWCYTPDFPNGTYAYFVAISSTGTPVFPYNIGRGYYGSPTGSNVTSISETVLTNFLGGPEATPLLNAPSAKNSALTLTWSATEGGTYEVLSTTNFSDWKTNSTSVAAVLNAAGFTDNPTDTARFYRVARTALAAYDSVGTGTGAGGGGGGNQGISSVLPASANRGTNSIPNIVTLTITLNSGYTMPPPPNYVQPTGVTLTGPATLSASSYSRNTTTGVVTATFSISSGTSATVYNVNATFGPNTWSVASAFTINP